MLNPAKHRAMLMGILKDIYTDPELRTLLGFKGGAAAMLFYHLPRISVDLDFNLLDEQKNHLVFKKVASLLPSHGQVRQATEKRYTLFFLISYEKGEHTIKIEISKRKGTGEFHVKQYLGISMLVMKKEDMTAGKLSALLTRKQFAARDLFDLWFFLKNNWGINEKVVQEKTGVSLINALNQAERKIKTVKKTDLLIGLGDLLDQKQKAWVKDHLVQDLLFEIRVCKSTMS
jgi:predicted nucleotidyltransferase component of viral defense system